MLEDLMLKRRQVRFFDREKYPDEELINLILEKTYHLVPSKQNLMPYKVHVLGPSMEDHKKELYLLSSKQQLGDRYQHLIKHNNGNTPLFAPYVLLFEKRLPKPNNFIKEVMRLGYKFKECRPEEQRNQRIATAVEIGLFTAMLTGFCMEEDISVGYIGCLPGKPETYKNNPSVNFDFIDQHIFLGIGLGYQDYSIDEKFRLSRLRNHGEEKPPINTVIFKH